MAGDEKTAEAAEESVTTPELAPIVVEADPNDELIRNADESVGRAGW